MSQDYTKPMEQVEGGLSFAQVDNLIAGQVEKKAPLKFWLSLGIPLFLLTLLGAAIVELLVYGIGVWGNNNPEAWAFDIVNFVYWVGIAHCGTLVSAMLFHLRQDWRAGIGRIAEAITIFAIMTAAMFPGIHIGRPWLAHWFIPSPTNKNLWVNWSSPLLWDFMALATYGAVSFTFWYLVLIPDFAVLRERAKGAISKFIYSLLSMGWRNSARHWAHFEKAYGVIAAVCIALVASVSTIVGSDFATSLVPGWHSMIFPPYFVIGALYCGFAATQLVLITVRWLYELEHIITTNHLEKMNKVMMVMGLIVAYIYFTEIFQAFYSGTEGELFLLFNRAFGAYSWAFWCMLGFNMLPLQLMWFKFARRSVVVTIFVSVCINIGMWFERHVIIISPISRDFLPSSWAYFIPTRADFMLFAGSFGLFLSLVFLFVRFVPVVSMAEVKSVMKGAQPKHDGEGEVQ